MCKKISNTFFIIRENNIKTDGYHFHAIIKPHTTPKKAWYKKGQHTHYVRIDRRVYGNSLIFTQQDIKDIKTTPELYNKVADEKISHGESLLDAHDEETEDRLISKLLKTSYRNDAVHKVLQYMLKEDPIQEQYTTYTLIIRNKSQLIT